MRKVGRDARTVCKEVSGCTRAPCGVEVAGGGAGMCRACVVDQRLRRDAKILPLVLDHAWARDLYVAFAEWLLQHDQGAPNLPAIYARQVEFFTRLDAVFAERNEVNAAGLLRHFEVAQLRRHLLTVRFVQEHLGFIVEPAYKAEAAEQSRVREKLYASRHEVWASILKDYARWHADKGTATRTLRQYLTATEHVLRQRKEVAYVQTDIDRALRQHPGSRANMAAFVRFGRERYGWDVSLPPVTGPRPDDPRGMVRRLKNALGQVDAQGVQAVNTTVLDHILRTAFGLSPAALATLWIDDLGVRLRLATDTQPVAVPKPLRAIAAEWQRRRGSTVDTH